MAVKMTQNGALRSDRHVGETPRHRGDKHSCDDPAHLADEARTAQSAETYQERIRRTRHVINKSKLRPSFNSYSF